MTALIARDPRTLASPLPLERGADAASSSSNSTAAVAAAGASVRRQLTYITVAWMFGSIWFNVAQGAVMTTFLKGLGATPMQFGLLAAMPYVAQLLSVPGSLMVERTGQRKRIFFDCHLLQRSLTLVVAAAPVALLACYGSPALPRAAALVLGLMFVMHALGATGGPAWVSWMSDVVPARVRGKYFAGRRQWGIVTAVPAAVAIGWGMDRLCAHPIGAAGGPAGEATSPLAGVPPVVFWGAALLAASTFFGLMDIVLFAPVAHTARPPRAGRELLASFAAPLRDRRFLTLSGFVAALNFTVGFTNQFATLYVIDRLKVDHIHAQLMLLVAPMLLQWAMLPAWGAAVDKMGQRPLLVLSGLGLIPMGFGWCLMGDGTAWLGYLLYAGGATLWTGVEVANFNAVIEASGRSAGHAGTAAAGGKKPTGAAKPAGGSGYHAVNTVLVNSLGCAGGLAAGLIAAGVGGRTWQPVAWLRPADFYDALFALSGAVRVLAVVAIVPLMADPAARSVGATARFLVTFTAGRVAELAGAVGRRVRPAGTDAAGPADGDGSDDGRGRPMPIVTFRPAADTGPAEARAAA